MKKVIIPNLPLQHTPTQALVWREILKQPQGSRILTMSEAYLEPDGMTEVRTLPDAEAIFLFTAGNGQMLVDDRVIPVNASQVLLIEPGEKHALSNTGKKPITYLTILIAR